MGGDRKPSREQVENLFEEALELRPSEVDGFLKETCRENPDLEAQVRALLKGHDRAGGILDGPGPGGAGGSFQAGVRFGPYRVVHPLGSGGMGRVYLAVREDAFLRRVALKVLRDHRASADARERLDTERRILASLSHPNIAQLLDGGVSGEGVPYLAMEYVEGLPITTYCDREGLSVEERLLLFRKVCAAVHHAHRNLVIHRDLKPSNILVTSRGEPKLLDFGIAKLLQAASTIHAYPITHPDLRALTPEYASPEQLRGEPLTTACDVYALGILLYELLAGVHPFPGDGLSPVEAMNRVCSEDPPRPSAAAGVGPEWRERATARGASASHLASRLRGDLDTIVLKALRKEPGRRYESAEQLSSDIRRHLSAEPVLAVGDSRGYRLRKFLRRRRFEAAAALAVAVTVLLGLAGALWQAGVARAERDRATGALRQAEASGEFLLGLFRTEVPGRVTADSLSAETMLRRGIARVEALDAFPMLQGSLLGVLGKAFGHLGEYHTSDTLLRRAVRRMDEAGAGHTSSGEAAALAGVLSELAEVLRILGDYPAALETARQAHGLRVRYLGSQAPEVARSLVQVGAILVYSGALEEADSLTRAALRIRRRSLGPDDPLVTNTLETIATLAIRRGNTEEGEALLRQSVDRRRRLEGPDTPSHATALLRLASFLLEERHQPAEAEALFRRALLILGPREPERATALAALAETVAAQGRRDEGARLYRDAIRIRNELFGATQAPVADLWHGLGEVLLDAGHLPEARDAFTRALEIWRAAFGPEHPATAYALSGLARVDLARGRPAEAEILARQALAVREDALAGSHLLTSRSKVLLGRVLLGEGDLSGADSLLSEAVLHLQEQMPGSREDLRGALETMALLHGRIETPREAAHRE